MCEIPTLLACLLLCALNEVALATQTHTHTYLGTYTHANCVIRAKVLQLLGNFKLIIWLVWNWTPQKISLGQVRHLKSSNVAISKGAAVQLAATAGSTIEKAIKNAFDAIPWNDKQGSNKKNRITATAKRQPVKRVGVSNQWGALKCN